MATLAAVENPQEELYMATESDPAAKKGSGPTEPNLLLVKPRPITSNLRGTVKHLRERAGRRSRFRGLGAFAVFLFLRDLIVNCICPAGQYDVSIRSNVANVVAELALAQFTMAWVHIVISEPSSKRWYRRVPGFRTWVKIAPAALVASVGSRVTFVMPMLVSTWSNSLQSPLEAIAAAVVALALTVLIEVPATVTFIRVAASMLPEEDEAIVPFDRTFGGKVVPAVVGGSGHIGLIDAWRSFDWASRIRFISVLVKSTMMQVGLCFVFVIVFFGELGLITGSFSPEKLRDLDPRISGL